MGKSRFVSRSIVSADESRSIRPAEGISAVHDGQAASVSTPEEAKGVRFEVALSPAGRTR
jgi:hypothetical protein